MNVLIKIAPVLVAIRFAYGAVSNLNKDVPVKTDIGQSSYLWLLLF